MHIWRQILFFKRMNIFQICDNTKRTVIIFCIRDAAIVFPARKTLAGGFPGKQQTPGNILSFRVISGCFQISAIAHYICLTAESGSKYSKRSGTTIIYIVKRVTETECKLFSHYRVGVINDEKMKKFSFMFRRFFWGRINKSRQRCGKCQLISRFSLPISSIGSTHFFL